MRYDNLPVQFDDEGDPYCPNQERFDIRTTPGSRAISLIDGGRQVETEDVTRERREVENVPSEKSGERVLGMTIDPVTRVGGAGALAFHAEIDPDDRLVLDGHSQATLFRGYETILEGRDPRDAVDLSSRVCGFEGAAHSIASSMALEMAVPVKPPPLGVWVRNMGQAAGFLLDHAGHLFLLAGPDYSEAALSETNPDVFETATNTAAPHADIHGYETVGDIMTALNPWDGELYLEVLRKAREVLQLASLMLGKYPHPSTATPGGLTTTIDRTTFTQFYTLLKGLADYAKKIPPIWDDILDFLLEYMDGFEQVGEGPANMISTGVWDDPDVYNARYEDVDEWGRARLSTPGVIVDGELRTTNLTEIDMGVEEFVDHSYYEDWTEGKQRFDTTPAGGPISPYHPWNKETRPKPESGSWNGSYSWGAAPRWDREPMETGAHARQWITAVAGELQNPYIEPTGDGLNLTVPEVALPEMTFRWDVPNRLNAAERLRAEAYHIPYAGIVCYVGLLEALDVLKAGEPHVHTSFTIPSSGTHRGVGFWETGRGSLTHYVSIEEGPLNMYQILAPSTWIASPRDPFDTPGPCEQAVVNTPLLEEYTDEEELTGVDILRAIRSLDPCMVCTAH
jgi:hydrogenase large subunit